MKTFRPLPFLLIVIGAAIGASSGLYIKSLGLSSAALGGFRMGIPFLLLLPSMIRRNSWRGPVGHRKQLWLASVLNTIRLVLYILAFKLTTMGNAVVLLYLWPIFAMVMHGIQNRQKPSVKEILIMAGAFAGVIIMNMHREFSFSGSDFLGTLAMTASALLLALTTLIFKSTLTENSETDTLFFQNAAGGVVFLILLMFEIPSASLPDLGLGVFYGFSVGILAFWCFFFALKRLPVFQYSAVAYVEVFFGILFGIIFLSEELTVNIIMGALLVVGMSFWAAAPKNGSAK